MTVVERLQRSGIRRLGTKRTGFRYRTPRGGRPSAADRERIQKLRLPPAWVRVAISRSPGARVQAVGRDAAGRWQYVYHPAHVRRREAEKHARMIAFGEALPRLRRALARDLAAPGLGRAPVLAAVARTLCASLLRPGSAEYVDANGSYGLATLRREHVRVNGDVVRFRFPGKGGKLQERTIREARVARIVDRLLALPGREVFKFVDEEGFVCDVKRSHINRYIKETMGESFSAKDFRTWAGSLVCACVLGRAGVEVDESKVARKRKVVAAVRETAASLGNTPAVCRTSYISPVVTEAFDAGRVLDAPFGSIDRILQRDVVGLHRCERALLDLLRGPRVPRRARRAA